MNRAESSVRHVDSHGLRILRVVVSRFEVCAIRICSAGAGERRLDGLTGGGDGAHIETRDRYLVSRLCDSVFPLGVKLRIHLLKKVICRGARLNVGTVIDELADRDLGSELGEAAEVIAMPMRRDQMIDLLEFR